MTTETPGVSGRVVLLAGAVPTAGLAVAQALLTAGARVVLTSRTGGGTVPDDAASFRCDLTDTDDVARLVTQVHDAVGPIDGLLPLVGGWRGGGGIPGQVEADFRALEPAFTALRLTSVAFWDDLVASPAGRVAVVSSTAVARPTAGGASYTALKAAAESWAGSLAHGFVGAQDPLRGAAAVLRVRALAGLEEAFARAVVDLWDTPAADLNGSTHTLA